MYEYVDITNLCDCKGTTNIWNKQGFDEKKRIYLLFSGKIDIKKGESFLERNPTSKISSHNPANNNLIRCRANGQSNTQAESDSAERKKDKMLYLSLKLTGRVYLTRMGLPRWVPGFHRGMDWTTRIAS